MPLVCAVLTRFRPRSVRAARPRRAGAAAVRPRHVDGRHRAGRVAASGGCLMSDVKPVPTESETIQASVPPPPEYPDGLPTPSRYFAILTIALGLILAVLNGA